MTADQRDIDTLIIGQGLAGAILAWQLMQQGQSVLIVNRENLPSASRVAAGLFNPVTGQRFVLQPHAETIIPAARDFYKQLEQQFKHTFFFDKPMLRIIRNEKELTAINKRKSDPAYSAYLGEITDSTSIKAAHGIIKQMQTGYLDTNALLDHLQHHFIEHNVYLNRCFRHEEMKQTRRGIHWQGVTAKNIIFCEGFMGKDNQWFDWLPFQPAKGEILSLKTDAKLPDHIINGGRWLLPLQHGHYKTGATYDHDLSTLEPTEKARHRLIAGMQGLMANRFDFEVVGHNAGVRPNTLDKNPFIGFHPEQRRIGIFNGFGSKGSMLIPWYAESFAKHIIHGSTIPAEADIARIQ